MLPKKNRLNLSHHFQSIRTTGRRTKIGPLTLLSRSVPEQKEFQINIIVPKTVTKLKPVRNRIRRLIFHNLRKNTARFPHDLQLIIMVYERLDSWDRSKRVKLFDQLTDQITPKS